MRARADISKSLTFPDNKSRRGDSWLESYQDLLGQWIGQGGGETEADQVMQPPDHNSEWSTLIGRECRDRALIGREFYIELKYFHDVATPALLCHKEGAQSIQSPSYGVIHVTH